MLSTLHLEVWATFIGTVAVMWWLFKSGDPKRFLTWVSKLAKHIKLVPDLSGYTVLASGAIVPKADNVEGLKALPDKIFTPTVSQRPAVRFTPQEVERRVAALDDMHAALVGPTLVATQSVIQAIADRWHTLLDRENGAHEIGQAVLSYRETIAKIDVDTEAVRRKRDPLPAWIVGGIKREAARRYKAYRSDAAVV
jgi:hypothetical protein